MNILQKFIFDKTEHNIHILKKGDSYLFKAKDIGVIFEIEKIRNSLKDYNENDKVVIEIETNGGVQDTMFLTESGMIKFAFSSRKPIAEPFRDWVINVIIELSRTGKYEINNLKEEIEMTTKRMEMSIHRALVDANHKEYIVYFGKIKEIDGKTLIKIGSTKDIKSSMSRLEKKFGYMNMFHIIQCSSNERFEKSLHNHIYIREFAYKESVNDMGQTSTEVFLMTDEEINKTVEIAKRNVHKYRETPTPIGISIDLDDIKQEIKTNNDQLNKKIDTLLNSYIPPIIENNFSEITNDGKFIDIEKKRMHGRGFKIQRYSTDGKTLLETYESCINVTRDSKIDKTSFPQIMRACKDNSIYKNYRWATLDRNCENDTFQNIPETLEKKGGNVKNGLIAMLNLNKTLIVDVFTTGLEAAKNRHFKSGAPISRAIRTGSQSGGHYFKEWKDCEEYLKEDFLKDNELPIKIPTKNSKPVNRIDNETNIKQFGSIQDVTRSYGISRKTLQDAIVNGHSVKGYKWEYAKK